MIDYKWILSNKLFHRKRYMISKTPEYKIMMYAKHRITGNLFIDIGSCPNINNYSKFLRRNFKKVITIDPNPKWKADMKIAIGSFNGTTKFYIGDNLGRADSLIHNPHISSTIWKNNNPIDVNIRTFDSLQLDADFVKVDVEGAEFEVLEGMRQYIPKKILIELHDERRETELYDKLIAMGYNSIYKFDVGHFLGEII